MLNEPNANVESKKNGVRHYTEDEMKYGWFTIRPGCLQVMLKPLLCLLTFVGCCMTSVVLQHMLPAVEPTLKRRYKLTDKEVTGLSVTQGISLIVAVILLGYFGNFRARKIRCISAGMALSGLGAIFFSIPHYRTEAHKPIPDVPKQHLMMFGLCRLSQIPCTSENVESPHMALFVLGQIMIGLGVAPLYCLVPAYLDEIINPKRMPLAMLVWFAGLLIGPIIGFVTSSVFLQIYIDIEQPKLLHQMDPQDMRWHGAWWLGYLVFGVITLFNSLIVSGFPVSLPGSQAIRDEYILKGHIPSNDDEVTESASGVLHATTSLLKNKAFAFNTLAIICVLFFLHTLGPFMIPLVMFKYGADPFKIAMPVMLALVFGLIVGTGIGGYLTYRLNLKTLAKGAAFLCLATQALCILGPLLFVIPGCNESNIAGVTKEYPAIGGKPMTKMRVNGSSEITAACNKDCGCSTFISQPVCGSNNVAYFDACHAGCQFKVTDDDYLNCTCVPPSAPGMKYGTAKKGFCDRGCGSWKVFVFVTFLATALLGANVVPSKVVVLRCVQNNQRSYALAVQQFLAVLVSFIPTHLVEYIMNHDCHIWQKDPCGRKGICWDYHVNSMSKSMTIFGLIVTALATACYFFSWHVYKSPKAIKSNRLLSDTSAAPDDPETKL